MTPVRHLLALLAIPGLLQGQQVAKVDPPAAQSGEGRSADDASVTTRTDARTITLSIPGPRGMITDRFGKPLAQTKVGYQFAIEFEHFTKATDELVVQFARSKLAVAERLAGREYQVTNEQILSHYKDRRWLPMIVSSLLEPDKVATYRKGLTDGLILHPFYYRHYPEGSSAAHIIGYTRSKGRLPSGPIVHGDLLFEDYYGGAGLENTLDAELTGTPGERQIIFHSGGKKLLDEQTKRPRIGNTVVTTLNLAWQEHAENVLRRHCKRGAFVVIDIPTGEVLVLASRPTFDLNQWIPRISTEDMKSLNEDESKPMWARAYQGVYPPASTFKPVVALTALTNNEVEEWTKISCPWRHRIGNEWFRNHSKYEGVRRLSVAQALAQSNNVWFYKVGIKTGPSSFLSVASRLGFGSKTGLPLFSESSGRLPTDEYVREKFGRPFTSGDTANYSIGQAWESTPLQVAQAMAGIANGSVLPRLHLIKQVQDHTGGVLQTAEPEARNTLTLDPDAVQVVHKGMMQVVNGGTGKRGSLSFTEIAAKTGTAQWTDERELAWFGGFLPYQNPRLAFVALYEGTPHEVVSGGKKAAPMVRAFFNPLKSEIEKMIKPPAKALIVEEDPEAAELVEPEDLPSDPDGKLVTPDGGILKGSPLRPLSEETDPDVLPPPVDPEEVEPLGPLPAIPVDDAPVAIPVDEDEDEPGQDPDEGDPDFDEDDPERDPDHEDEDEDEGPIRDE